MTGSCGRRRRCKAGTGVSVCQVILSQRLLPSTRRYCVAVSPPMLVLYPSEAITQYVLKDNFDNYRFRNLNFLFRRRVSILLTIFLLAGCLIGAKTCWASCLET